MSPPAFIDANVPSNAEGRGSAHEAGMRRLDAHRISSADTDFDSVPDVIRLDPWAMGE